MRLATATLISYDVPGWPDNVIDHTVPLGKRYRVDLDTKGPGTLANTAHPEWGRLTIDLIVDVDDGFPLPVCCLQITEGAQ